jgi:hypothetical protein
MTDEGQDDGVVVGSVRGGWGVNGRDEQRGSGQ